MPVLKDFPALNHNNFILCLIPKSIIETPEGFKPAMGSEAQEQRAA